MEIQNKEAQSLRGQKAEIQLKDGRKFAVIFGDDVWMKWASGVNLSVSTPPELHPEIKGHMKTTDDYSHVQDAELILADKKVLKISFIDPQYFTAHQSINSRQEVYET